MKFILTILAVLILFASGCVSVSYLPSDDSRTYPPTTSVKVFWEKPDVPYTVLGMITAESGDVGEEKIFAKLKKRAMKLGAHGLLMGNSSQTASAFGTFNQGTGYVIPIEKHRLEAIAIRFNEE